MRVTQDQAKTAAIAAARVELGRGGLAGWARPNAPIATQSVAATHALFNPTGGRNGTGVWVVELSAPNSIRHVRYVLDGSSGAVLGTLVSSWDWGNAPGWYRNGDDAPAEG